MTRQWWPPFEAAQPAAVVAAVAAVAEMETQQQALTQQWAQQLERAAYDVALAQARYEQVDPQLRLVAAALEQAWEAALQAQAHLEQEWAQVQAAHRHTLSAEEVALVQQMAADLPRLVGGRKHLAGRPQTAVAHAHCRRDPGQYARSRRHPYRRALADGAVTRLTATRPRHGHPPTRSCWRASASWRQRAMRIRPLPPRSTAKGWSAVGT
ncbi:MAG: hypothetical protein HS099_05380 [Ardenticatenaceae bacterium]|nr:hypothetical protein [Ardenticatenaceae bacterium]